MADAFLTLPLKKDYPDYFQVISEPIDMTVIETKIKADKVCIRLRRYICMAVYNFYIVSHDVT